MTTRTAPQTNLRTHAPIEEVRELERVISMHQAGYSDLHKLHIETVAALRAENQRLREALEPFAAFCLSDAATDWSACLKTFVSMKRNARSALKGE